jgi:hypothetical protein
MQPHTDRLLHPDGHLYDEAHITLQSPGLEQLQCFQQVCNKLTFQKSHVHSTPKETHLSPPIAAAAIPWPAASSSIQLFEPSCNMTSAKLQ